MLLVAGKLKRSDPGIDEEAVLMRALRDFNTPKVRCYKISKFCSKLLTGVQLYVVHLRGV